MERRSMVPMRAVADARLSHGDLRVLLALGAHADADGRNIWASVATLCAVARVTRSSFFRAIKRLVAFGYCTATPRHAPDGRQMTTLYALVYANQPDTGEGATQMGREGPAQTGRESAASLAPKLPKEPPKEPKKERTKKSPVTPRRPAGRPKKAKPAPPSPGEVEVTNRVWRTFPKRLDPPHDYVRARKAIVALLREGIAAEVLEEAALDYAHDCRASGRAAKYVKAIHNFYADDFWRTFRGMPEVRIKGLTRDEWIRARMDVAEFDALAQAVSDDDVPDPPEDADDIDPFVAMDAGA